MHGLPSEGKRLEAILFALFWRGLKDSLTPRSALLVCRKYWAYIFRDEPAPFQALLEI